MRRRSESPRALRPISCSLPPLGGAPYRYQEAPKRIRLRDKKSLMSVSAAFSTVSVSAITLSGLACEATPVSFDTPRSQNAYPTNR